MANRKEGIVYNCNVCGEKLTRDNARRAPDENRRFVTTCIDCEEKYFKKLAQTNGEHLAIFCCCMAYNVPFSAKLLPSPEEKKEVTWKSYIEAIEDRNPYDAMKWKTFFDGSTNILRIFGKDLTEKDVARYLKWEQERKGQTAQSGTETQRQTWGVNGGYTNEDYDELDRLYTNYIASYGDGVSLSPRKNDSIMDICKARMMGAKKMAEGDMVNAEKSYRIVDMLSASEALREKDQKPMEDARPDSFVKMLEDAGLMEDGDLLPLEELQAQLAKVFIKGANGKKYSCTEDAANQMILKMQNAFRRNEGLPMKVELDEDEAIQDFFGEFAETASQVEIDAKKYAGLSPVDIRKKTEG